MTTNPLLRTYRTRLHDLRPYRPGAAPSGGTLGRLSSNEAPLGPAPAVQRAIRDIADQVHRYPTQVPARAALATDLGVDVGHVMLTNGSDELCFLIAALAVSEGTTVVVPDPPYRIDEIACRLQGGEITRVPVRADGGLDLPAMADAARPGSVLWVPTPHNPTGVACPPAALESFLGAVPDDALVVIDEAYRAFCDPAMLAPTTRWARENPNVIVQRTFSKDYALAGLRAGYAVAATEVIEALDAIRPPFDLNAVASVAVVAAIGESEWRRRGVELVRRERGLFQRYLDTRGIEHYVSQANFVTLRLDHPRLVRPLAEAGLTVRAGEDLGLPGWTRVSIGTPEQMLRLRSVLDDVVTTPGGAAE